MSKKVKLTKQEIEDSKMVTAMVKRAEKERAGLVARTNANLMSIKIKQTLRPIIIKLRENKVITNEKADKLIDYLIADDYDKAKKELRKYPDYYKDDEAPKKTKKTKKKKVGKGINDSDTDSDSGSDSKIADYLNQF